jgi:hypothetical protein
MSVYRVDRAPQAESMPHYGAPEFKHLRDTSQGGAGAAHHFRACKAGSEPWRPKKKPVRVHRLKLRQLYQEESELNKKLNLGAAKALPTYRDTIYDRYGAGKVSRNPRLLALAPPHINPPFRQPAAEARHLRVQVAGGRKLIQVPTVLDAQSHLLVGAKIVP